MTAVHSARWHRVASLKPRLCAHVLPRRQRLRGETWVLLADSLSGRSVRLNATAYAMAGRFDGQRSVQQVWDGALEHAPETATQDELIALLARLREAGLVQFDRSADFDLLLPHLDQTLHKKRRGGSLLAWRVPVANPSRLLDLLQPVQALVFSRTALLGWMAALLALLVLALQHGPQLWAHGSTWLATPRFALLALLLYVPIKLVHELAHGMAVRRWGGQVREAGVTFMLMMPVPYVDASAATHFVHKRHRIAVSAAGIMAELALAAIALPLWLWLHEGLARDMAFVTLFICGVSTLLFNANPLQRLDGYYIATDALELPNLGPRSRQWWLDLMRRRLLRLPAAEAMVVARGETAWLAGYAPLSWLVALGISAAAVAWLGHLSFTLGLGSGLLLGWQMVLRPVTRLVGELRRSALGQDGTARRWQRVSLFGAGLVLLMACLPWPQRTLVQGVVWPPDQAQLRADEQGFVAQVLRADGDPVQTGEVVLQLANAPLQASLDRQLARVMALESGLFNALPVDHSTSTGADTRAGDARAELDAAQAELHRLQTRVDALSVRAHADGRLALPRDVVLPGGFVPRGSLVGQVLTAAPPTVRVAWPEAESGQWQRLHGAASVRLASAPAQSHAAQLLRDSMGAVNQLPSAALSATHGGPITTDPQDKLDLRTLQPVVLLDVQLAAAPAAGGLRLGERAWVRFDAGWSPWLPHALGALRQNVLQRFNASF